MGYELALVLLDRLSGTSSLFVQSYAMNVGGYLSRHNTSTPEFPHTKEGVSLTGGKRLGTHAREPL